MCILIKCACTEAEAVHTAAQSSIVVFFFPVLAEPSFDGNVFQAKLY